MFKRKGDSDHKNSLTHAGALHMHHDRHHKQYKVTMNNDGVPLRNLTLGGMVGGKTADNSKRLTILNINNIYSMIRF